MERLESNIKIHQVNAVGTDGKDMLVPTKLSPKICGSAKYDLAKRVLLG